MEGMNTMPSTSQTDDPSTHDLASRSGTIALGLASVWSAALLVVTILWGSGILEAPFGVVEPGRFSSLLDRFPIPVGAGIVGFCMLLSLVFAGILLSLPRLRSKAAPVVGLFTAALAAVKTVMFTDTLLLAYLGYTVSFQFPPIPDSVLWQGALVLGSGLWLAVWVGLGTDRRRPFGDEQTVSAEQWRNSSATSSATVRGSSPAVTKGASSAVTRSAKIAVGIAVAVPSLYAVTRILWAAGIPIGLSEEFYAEGLRIGMWHSGLSLAVAALVGALLTLGLVQSWGERLPRWAGPVGGRRVPIPVATIPATLVTVVVFTGGVGLVRETLLGAVNMTGNFGGLWATVGPTWLFPIWALALGWATHRYRRRRLEAHT